MPLEKLSSCKSGGGLNCFSGTWTPKDPAKAKADLKKVLESYPKTGQNDVDPVSYTHLTLPTTPYV